MNICRKHQPVKMSSIEIDCMAIFLRHSIVSKIYKKKCYSSHPRNTEIFSSLTGGRRTKVVNYTWNAHISLCLAVSDKYFWYYASFKWYVYVFLKITKSQYLEIHVDVDLYSVHQLQQGKCLNWEKQFQFIQHTVYNATVC